MTYSPEDLMRDAVDVLARLGAGPEAFESIGALLGRLAEDPGLLSHDRLASLHGSGATATILVEDPSGPALMIASFPSEAPTPVHNHNSWGVIRVIRGRDLHVSWRRTHDGSDPSRASLERGESRELGPGDVLHFPEPPGDIHSQQGVGESAWELVFFGRNPNARPRSYFDPETGLVQLDRADR